MANERFNWKASSNENCCFELHKRNVSRALYKDSQLRCLVCMERPRNGETVYYPAKGLSENNKIIGHKDCVDRVYKQMIAKHTDQKRKDLIDLGVAAGGLDQPVTPSRERSGEVARSAKPDAKSEARAKLSKPTAPEQIDAQNATKGASSSTDVQALRSEIERLQAELAKQESWKAGFEYACELLKKTQQGLNP